MEPRPTVFGLSHMFWAPVQMVKKEKQMQHLRQRGKGCCFCALKKEIAAAAGGGWGITEYLQLDWMDDEMNGWMDGWKKLHDHNVLYYV